ncbi:MAG: chorismate mutase, partial [Lachnospiraceae bacterium]|nr:chorismate mutase [Lachnospiraceae bacterium]
MDLLEIRDRIDSVDEKIVKLFEERMNLCIDV